MTSYGEWFSKWLHAHPRILVVAAEYNHGLIVDREIRKNELHPPQIRIATQVKDVIGVRNDGTVGVIVVASTSWAWDLIDCLRDHGFCEGDPNIKVWYT